RAQDAADDLDLLVLDLQFHRRFFADFLVSAGVPYPARYRHGRGMAGRRGPGNGELADPFARLYERGAARLLEHRLSAVERALRTVLRLHRLAWLVVGRRPARPVDRVDPLLRQGTGGLA